jgi:hypothetical protein
MSEPDRCAHGTAVRATATSERALPATSRDNLSARATTVADEGRAAMSGAIALVPVPADRYPAWLWLNGADMRAIVDAECPTAPIPFDHATLTAADHPTQVCAHRDQICAARVAERIAHLADRYTLLAAAAHMLRGMRRQSVSSAAAFDNRLRARERIAAVGIPVVPSAQVDRPITCPGRRVRIDALHWGLPPVSGLVVSRVTSPPGHGRTSQLALRHGRRISAPPDRRLARARPVPPRPAPRAVLAEPGGAPPAGQYAAVRDAVAATLGDLRGQAEAFTDWAKGALSVAARSRSAA